MQEVLVSVGYSGDSLRQIKGELSTSLFKARRKILPVIRKFLNAEDHRQNLPGEALDQLLQLEKHIQDSQFITSPAGALAGIKQLVLTINDKYDRPKIEDILGEINGSEYFLR